MGGSAYLVTLTVRHHRGHRLADLWDAVSYGWSAATSGRQWVEDSSGLLGWCRVVEATHTPRNGWHLHVHALMCWPGQVDEVEAQRVAVRAWARWDRALRRKGFDSTPVRGLDATRVRFAADGSDDGIGKYFTKIAMEVTASYVKDSRSGRSPLAILRDATETYRVEDLELWWEWERASWEWERASHGRQQLTWSTGTRDLRAMAGLREQTDEEIAMEEVGDEDMITLSGPAWEQISRAGQESTLLDLAETDGMAGVTGWLDARGLGWSPATPAPRRQGPPLRPPRVRDEARAAGERLATLQMTRSRLYRRQMRRRRSCWTIFPGQAEYGRVSGPEVNYRVAPGSRAGSAATRLKGPDRPGPLPAATHEGAPDRPNPLPAATHLRALDEPDPLPAATHAKAPRGGVA